METVKGFVWKVYQDQGRYAILVGDEPPRERFTGFGKCPYKEGTVATITYVVKGNFKNIVAGQGKPAEVQEQLKNLQRPISVTTDHGESLDYQQQDQKFRTPIQMIRTELAVVVIGKIRGKITPGMLDSWVHWCETGGWDLPDKSDRDVS